MNKLNRKEMRELIKRFQLMHISFSELVDVVNIDKLDSLVSPLINILKKLHPIAVEEAEYFVYEAPSMFKGDGYFEIEYNQTEEQSEGKEKNRKYKIHNLDEYLDYLVKEDIIVDK